MGVVGPVRWPLKTIETPVLLREKSLWPYFFILTKEIRIAGSSTRLVRVAVTRVSEVSQPSALVPSNPLKAKMINPAISTMDV